MQPFIAPLFLLFAGLCFFPFVTGATALLAGILFALAFGNPFPHQTKRFTPLLLQFSVMGLGAGMNLHSVARAGIQGVGYTCVGIALTLALGWLLGKSLKTDRETAILVTVGTAICGGSAIAAIAPVIRAKSAAISTALATVFLLNASALLFFPALGHWAGLSQSQFGLFSALAVHDTSSVVGTAMQYGAEALEIATPVKLARALWIIPLAWGIGSFWNRKQRDPATKPKRPWFILGFLALALLITVFPALQGPGTWVATAAKRCLVLTLFLIGSGLTRATLASVGPRPFLLGILLWICVSFGTLASLWTGWISI